MKNARSLGVLTAILAVTALLGSVQPANAGLVACDQPDMQVRGGGADAYLGDNIYNNDGDFQTKARKVRPDHTDGFQILLQNDGSDCSSAYIISGDGSSSDFTVHYFSGATDITADVVAGTYVTASLPLDGSLNLFMTVKAAKNAPSGASIKSLVTAATKGSSDTIGAKVTVRPKAGDVGGSRRH